MPKCNFNKVVKQLQRLWRLCFPVNFAKVLRTPFLQNTSGRLVLVYVVYRQTEKEIL